HRASDERLVRRRRKPVLVLGVVLDTARALRREDSDVVAVAELRALERALQVVPNLTKVSHANVSVRYDVEGAVRGECAVVYACRDVRCESQRCRLEGVRSARVLR